MLGIFHGRFRDKVLEQHWSISTLKLLIITVAILLIILALFIDNPWILAAILAYEVLP